MIKPTLKRIFGEIPLTAELYWYWRQAGQPLNQTFSLKQVEQGLPMWRAEVLAILDNSINGKRVVIFATLHYWISHATLLGLALAGLGHEVTFIYLPYGKWQRSINRFDLRRQNMYANHVLRKAAPLLETLSLLDVKDVPNHLPEDLHTAIQDISYKDTQYTLQVEDIDLENPLYLLRQERNSYAARSAMEVIKRTQPDVVITPNGSILEFGAVYQAARHVNENCFELPVVTYEFGEQRERMWLGLNTEVMRQQTDDLWLARPYQGLSEIQLEQVQSLFHARQGASLWENFARRWQGVPSSGGELVRNSLGLDNRPIVLLPTNVIGDSLTLGRQVFSESMTEWLTKTVSYFAENAQVQLVVRIHPGEMITKGPSVAGIVQRVLPDLPENIILVPADADVNTYDLVAIADLGLVYTTTVGLEMAMSGVPVIVIGQTHYRNKGFTLDPDTWETYFSLLDDVLDEPARFRLLKEQIDLAWEYAYRFFFEYPHPFPWHVVHMWDDIQTWTFDKVLGENGQEIFTSTFSYLVGEPVDWSQIG